MNKTKANIYSALFFFLFGLGFWIAIPYNVVVEASVGITAASYPQFVAVCMMILAAAQMISSIFQYRREQKIHKDPGSIPFTWNNEVRVLIVVVMMVAYALMFQFFGYIPATLIFTTAMLLLFRVKKWWGYVGVYAFCAIIYWVFTEILLISL